MRINQPKKIVISRTDSIGDVALTLPVAGILKEKFPDAHIVFLGNTYTKPIIECCTVVDEVWEWADIQNMTDPEQINWLKKQDVDVFIHVFPRRELARLAQKAKIKHRVGTSHRLYHLMTCNHRVNFSRKNSSLHEAQLNIKLLKPFGIDSTFSLSELTSYAQFKNITPLSAGLANLISKDKLNVLFHPKSKGSALEWGVENFIALAQVLDPTQYQIFFTGTEEESKYFRAKLPAQNNIIDLSGKLSLPELIAFINASDMLLACSTGPLHIAGLCNIKTIGLFTPRKPLHFGRWQPLGQQVKIIEEIEMSDRDQPLNINLRVVRKEIENFK
ncbi:MAG: glycosyltransferase family 9 protein [Putridiphycobacter sp.]